jgi:hypothetical protein
MHVFVHPLVDRLLGFGLGYIFERHASLIATVEIKARII